MACGTCGSARKALKDAIQKGVYKSIQTPSISKAPKTPRQLRAEARAIKIQARKEKIERRNERIKRRNELAALMAEKKQ